MKWVYMAPDFVPLTEAKVDIRTHGFSYGTLVFEGIRGYWDDQSQQVYIFRLKEHIERLTRNGRILKLEMPTTPDGLVEICRELVRKNGYQQDIYVKPIGYKGLPETLGVTLTQAPDEFLMYTFPLGKYLATDRALKVCVSSWHRVPDNAIPARGKIGGAYINSALAKSDAVAAGFDECIMLTSQGNVAEGSTSNLFLVMGGGLVTPPVTEDILVGITRQTIMEIARTELGLSVTERVVDRSELYMADELFFCGTGAEVAGIGEVDSRRIGSGQIGPITRQLQDLYFQVVHGRFPKYRSWCTPVYE